MLGNEGSLVDQLDLDLEEIEYLLFIRKSKPLSCKSDVSIRTNAKQSLQLKLRLEACNRVWQQILGSLPSSDDIEMFFMNLRKNELKSNQEKEKFVDYTSYKRALATCSEVLKNFLSAKAFMDLLEISSAKSEGLVSIFSIMDYVAIKKDKMRRMISLHYYDSEGKGFLSLKDLKQYIQQEILPEIPSLANLKEEEPELEENYLCIAAQKFFFLLDTVGARKIRIIDVVASRLLEEFEILNDILSDDEESVETEGKKSSASNWFSKENCMRIINLYRRLDEDGNGLLSLSEMLNFQLISNAFIQRVFETSQTYEKQEIDLKGFCDFLYAIENRSDPSSISYHFRLMDVDGDNFLSCSDIELFYRDIAKLFEDNFSDDSSLKAPSYEIIKNEIFDMCNTRNSKGITLKELIASGKGETVVGMLTNADAFFEYENREDFVSKE